MSCESLVDVGVELTTLFEFQFFRICPPEKNARSTMHIRACIKRAKNTRDGVDILNSSTLSVIGVVASAPQQHRTHAHGSKAVMNIQLFIYAKRYCANAQPCEP